MVTEPMYSEDVSNWVESNNESDAYCLFLEKFPGMSTKLKRASNKLAELLKEIQKEFPDACYYTASGGFHLILGETHDRGAVSHQERYAWGATGLHISDGDW